MKSLLFLSATLSAGLSLFAEPLVSNVIARQGLGSRKVTVSYTFASEPAVITVDVQTNRGDGVWASIGAANQVSFTGDLNCLVQPGTRGFVWNAGKDWPDRLIRGGNVRFAVSAWVTNAPPDYMVVDLYDTTAAHRVLYYASADFVPGGVTNDLYKTTHLLMRKIPAGGVEWLMGSPENESGRMTDERGVGWERQHRVILSDDYYIGVYETTQKQYSRFNPFHRSHPNNTRSIDGCASGTEYDTYPLNRMFLTDFRGLTNGLCWPTSRDVDQKSWLGELRAEIGLDFDLPTEAQWEFACRGLKMTAFCDGENPQGAPNDHIFGLAGIGSWAHYFYGGNAMRPVGEKRPNGFGLYDIIGNVYEMCLDWKGDYPDGSGVSVDPRGAAKPDPYDETAYSLIVRGGFYGGVADALRSAWRGTCPVKNWSEAIGFRLVCPAVAK